MTRCVKTGLPRVLCTPAPGLGSSWTKVRNYFLGSARLAAVWYLIFMFPAHKIRNRSSKIFQAACEIPARNRWCLTGTPIQNSLDDFGSLLAFVGVLPFVTHDQFKFWISAPLHSSQQHSLRTLRKLVRATCLRRTKSQSRLSSTLKLPAKKERIEAVELHSEERELYDFFKRRFYLLVGGDPEPAPKPEPRQTRKRKRGKKGNSPETNQRKNTGSIIVLLSVLRRICDHGGALLPPAALEIWRKRDLGMLSWTSLEAAGLGQKCCRCGKGVSDSHGEQAELNMVELPCGKHAECDACASSDDGLAACPTCPSVAAGSSKRPEHAPIASRHPPSSKVSAILRNLDSHLKGGSDGSATKRFVNFR